MDRKSNSITKSRNNSKSKNTPKSQNAPKADPRKNALIKSLVGAALLAALGVLLVLCPDFATNTLASVLGWILIGGGAILIAVTVLNWDVIGWPELIVGIVAAAAGIFIVIRPDFLAAAFGVLIGIYVAFQALSNLVSALRRQKAGKMFLPSLILGLVLLALALVLIFVPMSFSRLLVQTVGVVMIISGVTHLVLRSKFLADRPRKEPKVVDAREDD